MNHDGYGDAFSSNSYTYATLYVPEGSFWSYAYDCPWTFIHMKEMVNDANEVKQDMLYMLADAEGANYSVYDTDNKEIRTIDYTHNLDEESLGTYWQIQKNGSNRYLYSPAANQYASMQNGKLQLSTTPININLSQQDGTLTIGGTKCMLVLNTELENTTDISTPTAMQSQGQKYDLQGRKLSSANGFKGIYIQDGKKVLMK